MTSWAKRLSKPPELTGPWGVYGGETVDGDAVWELFVAAADGDVLKIEEMLRADANLINAQYWYSNALRFAVLGGHADATKLLLDYGSEPGILEANLYDWETHLEVSALRGFECVHELLLDEMQSRYRFEPNNIEFGVLRRLIEAGEIDAAIELLEQKPKLNHVSDIRGKTALHWAVRVGSLELLEYCIDHGADVNIHNADGEPPIGVDAESEGGNETAHALKQRLLDSGADCDFQTACFLGDEELVDDFLSRNPELPNTLNHACVSPLASASRGNQIGIIEKLLGAGADINLCERRFSSGGALFVACALGHYEIAELLLKRGADPNATCESSGTSADHAATKEILELLKLHGSQGCWDEMDHSLPPLQKSITDKRHDLDGLHRFSLLGQVIRENDSELLSLYIEHMGTDIIRKAHPGLGRSGWLTPTHAGEAFLQQLLDAGFDFNRPEGERTCSFSRIETICGA